MYMHYSVAGHIDGMKLGGGDISPETFGPEGPDQKKRSPHVYSTMAHAE